MPEHPFAAERWLRLLGGGALDAKCQPDQCRQIMGLLWAATTHPSAHVRSAAYEALGCYPMLDLEALECLRPASDYASLLLQEEDPVARTACAALVDQALAYEHERRRRNLVALQTAGAAAAAFDRRLGGRQARTGLSPASLALRQAGSRLLSSSSSRGISAPLTALLLFVSRNQGRDAAVDFHRLFLGAAPSVSGLGSGFRGLTPASLLSVEAACWTRFTGRWAAACRDALREPAPLWMGGDMLTQELQKQASQDGGVCAAAAGYSVLLGLLGRHLALLRSCPADQFSQAAWDSVLLAMGATASSIPAGRGSESLAVRTCSVLATEMEAALQQGAPRAAVVAVVALGTALASPSVQDLQAVQDPLLRLVDLVRRHVDGPSAGPPAAVAGACLETLGRLGALLAPRRSPLASLAMVTCLVVARAAHGTSLPALQAMFDAVAASEQGSEAAALALGLLDWDLAAACHSAGERWARQPPAGLGEVLESSALALAHVVPALGGCKALPQGAAQGSALHLLTETAALLPDTAQQAPVRRGLACCVPAWIPCVPEELQSQLLSSSLHWIKQLNLGPDGDWAVAAAVGCMGALSLSRGMDTAEACAAHLASQLASAGTWDRHAAAVGIACLLGGLGGVLCLPGSESSGHLEAVVAQAVDPRGGSSRQLHSLFKSAVDAAVDTPATGASSQVALRLGVGLVVSALRPVAARLVPEETEREEDGLGDLLEGAVRPVKSLPQGSGLRQLLEELPALLRAAVALGDGGLAAAALGAIAGAERLPPAGWAVIHQEGVRTAQALAEEGGAAAAELMGASVLLLVRHAADPKTGLSPLLLELLRPGAVDALPRPATETLLVGLDRGLGAVSEGRAAEVLLQLAGSLKAPSDRAAFLRGLLRYIALTEEGQGPHQRAVAIPAAAQALAAAARGLPQLPAFAPHVWEEALLLGADGEEAGTASADPEDRVWPLVLQCARRLGPQHALEAVAAMQGTPWHACFVRAFLVWSGSARSSELLPCRQ